MNLTGRSQSLLVKVRKAALAPLGQAVGKLPAARVWVSLNEPLLL